MPSKQIWYMTADCLGHSEVEVHVTVGGPGRVVVLPLLPWLPPLPDEDESTQVEFWQIWPVVGQSVSFAQEPAVVLGTHLPVGERERARDGEGGWVVCREKDAWAYDR